MKFNSRWKLRVIMFPLFIFVAAESHAVVFTFTDQQVYQNVGFGGLGSGPVQFSNGVEEISASAYALSANNSANGFTNTFRNANLTRNANNGLGVNRGNDSSGQIDNQDNIDLILFDFGQSTADPLSIVFSLFSANDNVSIWLGNGLNSLYADLGNSIDSFLDLNFNTLVSVAGFTQFALNSNLSLNNPYSILSNNYQYLVVAAPDYRVAGNPNDNFRVASLEVNDPVKLPGPSVPALFAAGLLGWMMSRIPGKRAKHAWSIRFQAIIGSVRFER